MLMNTELSSESSESSDEDADADADADAEAGVSKTRVPVTLIGITLRPPPAERSVVMDGEDAEAGAGADDNASAVA